MLLISVILTNFAYYSLKMFAVILEKNPNFNYTEFGTIKNAAGSNNFVLSTTQQHGIVKLRFHLKGANLTT